MCTGLQEWVFALWREKPYFRARNSRRGRGREIYPYHPQDQSQFTISLIHRSAINFLLGLSDLYWFDHQVPLELGKTLLALIWLVSGFFATTLRWPPSNKPEVWSLAIGGTGGLFAIFWVYFSAPLPHYLIHFSATSLALTHDRVPDSAPLPDILLDSVQYQVICRQIMKMLLNMTSMQMVMIMINVVPFMIKMLLIMALWKLSHVWGLAGNEMLLILLIFSFNIFSLFVCLRSGVWQAARCCSCSVLPQLLSSL